MIPSTLIRAAKWSSLALGHYGRVLAATTFPGVAVLCYHGLRPDGLAAGAMPLEDLHVCASTFEAHCRLVRETCHPISLDGWRAALRGERHLPARPVLMTFDDGYRSVATIAAPLLEQFELPAVVFVCSEPIAERRLLWFDAIASRDGDAAVERWKSLEYEEWRRGCVSVPSTVNDDDPRAVMTVAQLQTLSRRSGIEIGAHTARHPILARGAVQRQQEEIAESRDAIAGWIGRPVRAFAYPNGRRDLDYSPATVGVLADLGFDAAFGINDSFARPQEPALERSRFLMLASITGAELAHRLAYTWPR
jgi:peptidoglycan/xylan/chitin deacetylase (PgdA/CDA1 family)